MTCPEFVDSIWGFAVSVHNFVSGWDWPQDSPCVFQIYRCAGTDESAWNRMLQHIHNSVNEALTEYGYEDLLPHHNLHVVDERPLQV